MHRPSALRGIFGRLARSTPVRLAFGLVALFSLVSVATLGAAFVQLRGNLSEQIADSLDQHLAGFRVTNDPATLAALVAAEAAATDPENRVLVFIAPGGRRAGNARADIRGAEVRLSRIEGGEISPATDMRRASCRWPAVCWWWARASNRCGISKRPSSIWSP